MKDRKIFSAYTLIELLVVVSIISILFFLILSAYNNYKKTQVLFNWVQNFKTALREAQNKAISGEKDLSVCGSSGKTLVSWIVYWDKTVDEEYRVFGYCSDLQDFSSTSTRIPDEIDINPGSGQVSFLPVDGGSSGTISDLCITSNNGISFSIGVSQAGEIRETKYANNTCTI